MEIEFFVRLLAEYGLLLIEPVWNGNFFHKVDGQADGGLLIEPVWNGNCPIAIMLQEATNF